MRRLLSSRSLPQATRSWDAGGQPRSHSNFFFNSHTEAHGSTCWTLILGWSTLVAIHSSMEWVSLAQPHCTWWRTTDERAVRGRAPDEVGGGGGGASINTDSEEGVGETAPTAALALVAVVVVVARSWPWQTRSNWRTSSSWDSVCVATDLVRDQMLSLLEGKWSSQRRPFDVWVAADTCVVNCPEKVVVAVVACIP